MLGASRNAKLQVCSSGQWTGSRCAFAIGSAGGELYGARLRSRPSTRSSDRIQTTPRCNSTSASAPTPYSISTDGLDAFDAHTWSTSGATAPTQSSSTPTTPAAPNLEACDQRGGTHVLGPTASSCTDAILTDTYSTSSATNTKAACTNSRGTGSAHSTDNYSTSSANSTNALGANISRRRRRDPQHQ